MDGKVIGGDRWDDDDGFVDPMPFQQEWTNQEGELEAFLEFLLGGDFNHGTAATATEGREEGCRAMEEELGLGGCAMEPLFQLI